MTLITANQARASSELSYVMALIQRKLDLQQKEPARKWPNCVFPRTLGSETASELRRLGYRVRELSEEISVEW